MGTLTRTAAVIALAAIAVACTEIRMTDPEPAPVLRYPEAPRSDVVDTIHGVAVPDPWRPLEDPDAPESRRWIDAQNELTNAVLAKSRSRGAIRDRLQALWSFERMGIPTEEGGRLFYLRNDGLQQQAALWTSNPDGSDARVLLDPNRLAADGTVAINGTSPSPDGRLLAYATAEAGSDWMQWRVLDVATGRDLPDVIRWVKFSGVSWLPDASGFFYSRYPEPEQGAELRGALYGQRVHFHRMGTPQSDDPVVYERPDHREWGFATSVTDDGRWLCLGVWRGTERRNAFFLRDLTVPGSPFVELLNEWDAEYHFLGNDGATLWFLTDLDAPMRRVIAIDAADPRRDAWRTIVPESREALESASLVGPRLICRYLHDAHARVTVHESDGRRVGDVALPGLGTVAGFDGRRSSNLTWYAFTGFTTPAEIHRFDVTTCTSELHARPKVAFDPSEYETEQVFCTSRDGTRVPLFITSRRGTPRDGTAPCVLTGYGGFNAAITPAFSVSHLVWMERGGIVATACLRGGGEYGREWHLAGTKLRKQNVFDDFIACAEHLVRERRTSSRRLAISGGSNGGLLVGACMTQRPDLFGAALPAVGVLDMLRYHKFTIGWAWASDYGTADDPDEFRALLAYSPLHNLKPGTHYPATLITTGDHDDRVVPAHSFKFAAALQAAQGGTAPCLVRIETRAGHGAGKPTSKVIDEAADRWAFLHLVFGLE